jgi:hypothetical protein
MDNATKYFVKTLKGKTDRERTKKLKEMNDTFEATLVSESYPGPLRRTTMQGVNDVIAQFREEDKKRAMCHARKVGKILRSRE